MKYKILFTDWEGELNFFEPTEIFKNAGNEKDYNYYLVDKREAKRFMNNCPLISVNEEN